VAAGRSKDVVATPGDPPFVSVVASDDAAARCVTSPGIDYDTWHTIYHRRHVSCSIHPFANHPPLLESRHYFRII